MIKREIVRFTYGKKESYIDNLIEEIYLRIFVNGKEIAILSTIPSDIEYLIYGFLFTSNLINSITEIKDLKIDRQFCYIELTNENAVDFSNKRIDSGCGSPYVLSPPLFEIESEMKIEGEKIIALVKNFQKKSEIFRATGAVHSCGLSDGEAIITFYEDIGRHNAFDKIIGYAICKGVILEDKLVVVSGRITSELVFKCVRAKIPLLVSISACSEFAVKIAESYKITLCGFARGKRFNIYTCPERIL